MRAPLEHFKPLPEESSWLQERGLDRIPLPTAFPIPPVNVILVRGAEGVALIDTGMDFDNNLLRLEVELGLRGIRWSDIKQVYLTHPHIDHFGLASQIVARSGASLLAWKPAKGRFENRQQDFAREMEVYENWFVEGGFDLETFQRPTYQIDTLESPVVDGEVPVGEEFSMVGHRVQAIHVPGHSPWCVSYWFPDAEVLVSGDCLLERISPNPIVYPQDAAPSDWQGISVYRRSLSRLESLPVKRVIPGHGSAFSDSQKAIDMIRLHQEQRRKRVIQRLHEDGPLSLYELGLALFGERPLQSSLVLVFSELYRHVEWLQEESLLTEEVRDGIRRYHLPVLPPT